MSSETLSAIRAIVEEWNNGQCSPRRAMHFLDSLVAILAATQPPASSLAQAVKDGLAKRFPDDPPMEIHPPWCSGGCCNPPVASQPVAAPTPVTDEQIQSLWDVACEASPKTPAWNRHIRFARAVLALAAVQGKK